VADKPSSVPFDKRRVALMYLGCVSPHTSSDSSFDSACAFTQDTILHTGKDLVVAPVHYCTIIPVKGTPSIALRTSLWAPRGLRRAGVTCYLCYAIAHVAMCSDFPPLDTHIVCRRGEYLAAQHYTICSVLSRLNYTTLSYYWFAFPPLSSDLNCSMVFVIFCIFCVASCTVSWAAPTFSDVAVSMGTMFV
jgi:hypothetical protein